jgi:hypothetical protein
MSIPSPPLFAIISLLRKLAAFINNTTVIGRDKRPVARSGGLITVCLADFKAVFGGPAISNIPRRPILRHRIAPHTTTWGKGSLCAWIYRQDVAGGYRIRTMLSNPSHKILLNINFCYCVYNIDPKKHVDRYCKIVTHGKYGSLFAYLGSSI